MRTPTLLADPPDTPWRAARWGLGDAAVAGAVALVASSIVSAVALAVILPTMLADPAAMADTEKLTDSLMSSGPLLFGSVLALWIGFVGGPAVATRLRGNRSLAVDFGLKVRPRDIGVGVGAGAAMLAFSAVATAAGSAAGLDLSDADNAAFLATLPTVWKPVIALCVAVGAPFAEELFFRGMLLRALLKTKTLRRASNTVAGIVAITASSLLFGLAHLSAASVGGLFLVAITATFGAVLAVLATTTGRLGAGITAHVCVNVVGVAAVLLW